jgi:hypothetical protein
MPTPDWSRNSSERIWFPDGIKCRSIACRDPTEVPGSKFHLCGGRKGATMQDSATYRGLSTGSNLSPQAGRGKKPLRQFHRNPLWRKRTSAKGRRKESAAVASARRYVNSNRSTSSARWRQTTAMSSITALSSGLNACRANSAHSAACARYRSARTSTGADTLIRGFPAMYSGIMTAERNTTISVPETQDTARKID